MTRYHEIEVKARNHEGAEHTIYAEIDTQSDDIKGAASEVLESYAKEHGKDKVKYIETAR